MKAAFLAAALAVAPAATAYHIDLTRYFATPATEQSTRVALIKRIDAFVKAPPSSLHSPKSLLAWLNHYDGLVKALQRHDIYVYVRSEENSSDHADAAADDALGDMADRIHSTTSRMLTGIGAKKLNDYMARTEALARYRFFIATSRAQSAHESRDPKAEALLAGPALDSLEDSYKRLRPKPATSTVGNAQTDAAARAAFNAKWTPYSRRGEALSAILIPIVKLQNGVAKLHNFPGAPDRIYFDAGLTQVLVNQTLGAVRASDSDKRFETIVAQQVARRLGVPIDKVHAWDLSLADSYHPAATPFAEAVRDVLAAVRPMGAEYAEQYDALFAPRNRRVEWCHARTCDPAGFSVGFAGSTSGLFYGAYRGTTDNIRAVAHEAGHAVHRQFMNENQPLAVYNSGPHFLFESFAIFNGFLLEDYLYRSAKMPAQKAYYLHRFLDDATFNVYGSAKETDLEQSIYAGVEKGTIDNAAELDAQTLTVFARYVPPVALSPAMQAYWARDTLYFTDPLYDVNYLFAGLLALNYLRQFEKDPAGFSRHYVALLKNGFTNSPQAMLEKFLNVDMTDVPGLVKGATTEIDRHATRLGSLYAEARKRRTR
ncbi:MAG: M3 family metallopeptidase [Rhizomicrobium sp.]